jgi:hypothetical protein
MYLVAEFVVHEVLEGAHSVLYREIAVRLEQSFVSLTVAQEEEHALGQFVCVCNIRDYVKLQLHETGSLSSRKRNVNPSESHPTLLLSPVPK